MTKDEIMETAKLAGWEMDDSLVLEPEIVWYVCQGQLESFAALVAAAEREECAKQLNALGNDHCAAAIRARSKA
jgi:hypothetical protein